MECRPKMMMMTIMEHSVKEKYLGRGGGQQDSEGK
jgi:hypothetical protein